MDYIELILSYILIWWVLLFCILPMGNPTTYDEVAQTGNAASAPPKHNMKRKVLWTTLLSFPVLGIVYAVLQYLPVKEWSAAWIS